MNDKTMPRMTLTVLLLVLLLLHFNAQSVRAAGHETHYTRWGITWPKSAMPVKYYVEQELIDLGFLNAIIQAFQTWENDPGSYIDFQYGGSFPTDTLLYNENRINEIRLAREGDGVGGITAVTHALDFTTGIYTEFDIRFDKDEPWSTGGQADKLDIQNTATHEAGHALGLSDYDCADETMYQPWALGDLHKRDLFEGDIAGVRALYPGAVGGVVVSVDKFGLLAPYIGLASTTIIALTATTIYIKRFKNKKQKQ